MDVDATGRPVVMAAYDRFGNSIWTRKLGRLKSIDALATSALGASLLTGTLAADDSSGLRGWLGDESTPPELCDATASQAPSSGNALNSETGDGQEVRIFIAKLAP